MLPSTQPNILICWKRPMIQYRTSSERSMKCEILRTTTLLLYWLCSALPSIASGVDPATICPPSEIIDPCVCFKDCKQCFANIQCQNISDQEILSRVLDDSSDYQYTGFVLKLSSVMYIPDSIFEAHKMTHLTVMESSLISLFDRTPSAESLINYIFLDKLQIHRGLQWELFSGFKNLKKLAIFHTHVPKIERSFVKFVPKSLEELKINDCSTSRIRDDAFASFPDLLEVYVVAGRIKEVKRSMFPVPSKLKVFSFSGNQLSSLPQDIFSEMPDLKYIYLRNNFLKEMPQNIFGPIFPNLLIFYIDGNPLQCRCSVSWVTVGERRVKRRYFLGSCQEPKNLHGKELRSLVHEDFLHCG